MTTGTPDGFKSQLYDGIVRLVREYSPEPLILPESRLYHDLGINGEDAQALFLTLQKQFKVDLMDFCIDRHFEPESPFILFNFLYRSIRQAVSRSSCRPKMVPITVSDLCKAVDAGKFTDLNNRDPE